MHNTLLTKLWLVIKPINFYKNAYHSLTEKFQKFNNSLLKTVKGLYFAETELKDMSGLGVIDCVKLFSTCRNLSTNK